ncbi:hypothetical protein METH_09920 [Leisingera methylohalidivorans DSM 14336]|uniref:Uncharacterized protein n=1 Tax=Leisingera methylohalidivorans DSM 14336 TaxID=999552 RepID=V9W1K7_9RHOB|nr:hypothetical protein METH_09920 [Leisingera methylohalidivorans DSM 14336]
MKLPLARHSKSSFAYFSGAFRGVIAYPRATS